MLRNSITRHLPLACPLMVCVEAATFWASLQGWPKR
jgi:hypothetical protein